MSGVPVVLRGTSALRGISAKLHVIRTKSIAGSSPSVGSERRHHAVGRPGPKRRLATLAHQSAGLVDWSGPDSSFPGHEVSVVPDAITPEQHDVLIQELNQVFGRRRYSTGHWDAVIIDYKETERQDDGGWTPQCQAIINEVRQLQCMPKGLGAWLPVHAIDLAPTGHIKPHVDSIKFSGKIVAGLSLLSAAVMRLRHPANGSQVDLLLPPRSLYILQGAARYEYEHEILPHQGEPIVWQGIEHRRGRRISLIFRDELVQDPE